jgi:hypothetical protein
VELMTSTQKKMLHVTIRLNSSYVNVKCNRSVKLFGRREVVNTSAVHVQLN